jgi:hypothetical protein
MTLTVCEHCGGLGHEGRDETGENWCPYCDDGLRCGDCGCAHCECDLIEKDFAEHPYCEQCGTDRPCECDA